MHHGGLSQGGEIVSEYSNAWIDMRRALAPGGLFADQLFGTRDTWADDLR
jgi:hypothetical protein